MNTLFLLGASNSKEIVSQTSIINSTTDIATVSKNTINPKNDAISPQTTQKMEYTDTISTGIESLQTNAYSTTISIITGGNKIASFMKAGLENTTVPSTTSTFKTTTNTGNSISFILSI